MVNKITQLLQIKKPLVAVLVLFVVLGVGISVVQATLVSGGEIIDPPSSVAFDQPDAFNNMQQAFHEQNDVLLTEPVVCSNAILDPGERVNSHMIFFNESGEGIYHDRNVVWTFENEVLCFMKDELAQVTTDSTLGLSPSVVYPGVNTGRGMETQPDFSEDEVVVSGNQITVTMTDEGPGDRLRVLTRSSDATPPEVSCVAGKGGVYELVATDDRDELVSVTLKDTLTGQEFEPLDSGMTIKHIQAKGGSSSMKPSNSSVDYMIKTPGELLITASDAAGNENTAPCTVGG